MELNNMSKHQLNKGMKAITHLLLLAACTNSQENRFDIPKSKSQRSKRPGQLKVNA